jgi:hypothetical protein
MGRQEGIGALLDRHGRTYAEELGKRSDQL